MPGSSERPSRRRHPPWLVRRVAAWPRLWVTVVALTAMVLVARSLCLRRTGGPALSMPLPAFTLVDQQGRPFGLADLQGKVWVADFFYTTCPAICPRLTRRMFDIQERTARLGNRFQLVSFSVDPSNDTPDRLRSYAAQFHANLSRWTFVTGPLDAIEHTVVQGFKIAMGREGDAAVGGGSLLSIFHGERLVLVDQEGRIRGYYDANDVGEASLVVDATHLLAER